MKLINRTTLGLIAISHLHAATLTWDGSSGDGLWATAANWDTNAIPTANDTVLITNGDTVSWNGTLPSSLDIQVSGGSTFAGTGTVVRANNMTLSLASDATWTSVGGTFWDLDDADITFDSGATVTIDDWENKDVNTFTFNFGATGFETLTPNRFLIGNGSLTQDITNATYTVNLGSFAPEVGVYTLVDYTTDSEGMDNSIFQNANLVVNTPDGYIANLQWNDASEAIELNVTAIPEPSTSVLIGLASLALLTRIRRK